MQTVAKLTGWDPPFTTGLAKEYRHRYARFDNSKTIKDFNYSFHSLQETIHDTIKWFAFSSQKIKLDKKIIGQLSTEPDWLEAAVVND